MQFSSRDNRFQQPSNSRNYLNMQNKSQTRKNPSTKTKLGYLTGYIQGRNGHNQKESSPVHLQKKEHQVEDYCSNLHFEVLYHPIEAFLLYMQPSLSPPSWEQNKIIYWKEPVEIRGGMKELNVHVLVITLKFTNSRKFPSTITKWMCRIPALHCP